MSKPDKKNTEKKSLFWHVRHLLGKLLLTLFIILLIIIGFSQTATFRKLLRDQLISIAKDELNGEIDIESIEGSLISSISLKNISYSLNGIQILKGDRLSTNFSLIGLINKNIGINEVILENFDINFVRFKDSTWFFEKIVKKIRPEDTTESAPFNYKIILRNFQLINCNFRLADLTQINSLSENKIYSAINSSDLSIKNINFRLQSLLNLPEKKLSLKIRELNFLTNINELNLKQFNTNVYINREKIDISNTDLKTINSGIKLRTTLTGINIFDTLINEQIKSAVISTELKIDPFGFKDLTVLLPDINMLSGVIDGYINTSGTINDLNINKVTLSTGDTKLKVFGKIKNLTSPDDMFISTEIFESSVFFKDIYTLLNPLNIEFLNKQVRIDINKIKYEGKPVQFNVEGMLSSSDGNIDLAAKFDFSQKNPVYETDLKIKQFDFSQFVNLNSRINSNIKLKGQGFNPQDINFQGDILLGKSHIDHLKIDSSYISINGRNNIFNLSSFIKSDETVLDLEGSLNNSLKEYSLLLNSNELNIGEIVNNDSLKTRVNSSLYLKGKNYDLDNLFLQCNLNTTNSYFKDKLIPPQKVSAEINFESLNKSISINSSVADIKVNGEFLPTFLISDIPKHINDLLKIINKKINSFQNAVPFSDTVKIVDNRTKTSGKSKEKDSNYAFDFQILLKDFSVIENFTDDFKFNASGTLKGDFKKNVNTFSFSIENIFNELWFVQQNDFIRLKKANLNFNLSETEITRDSSNITAKMAMNFDKLNNNFEVSNFRSQINLNSEKLNYRVSAELDTTIKLRTSGEFDITNPELVAKISQASIDYNKYRLTNLGILEFVFGKDGIDFREFTLRRKNELINISGFVGFGGKQNFKLSVNKFSVADIYTNFVPENKNKIDGLFTLNANISGDASSPVINANFFIDSNIINGKNIGTIIGEAFYRDKKLLVDVDFLNNLLSKKDLTLQAVIPTDFTLGNVKERLIKDDSLDIKLNCENFDLSFLDAIVTDLKNTSGYLNGGIEVHGSLNNPILSGNLRTDKFMFLLAVNNLNYIIDSKFSLTEEVIKIENFSISNYNVAKNGGTIKAEGEISLKDFDIDRVNISMFGSLLLLNDDSRKVNQQFYGDLLLNTEKPITLSGDKTLMQLKGEVLVKKAFLTIPFLETEYSKDEETFKYVYKNYNTETDTDSSDLYFQTLTRNSKIIDSANNQVKLHSGGLFSNFISELKIKMSDEVNLTFILNRELNQRLFTELNGDLIFKLIDNQVYFQGEIVVSPESYLVFYQRFNASGTLRFERDIANPSLNITATYSNYYTAGDSTGSSYKDVQVKIKLVGTVKDLAKNLVQNPENISVEIDGQPDKTKDASDVVAFILFGKFKNDLTAQDKSNASNTFGNTVQGAATSLFGSLVAGFANQVFGDVIRSFDVQQVGGQTVFSLTGKIEKLKFKFGGSTNTLQNLTNADIQLEYPLLEKLYLRLERKNISFRTNAELEMINEVALKYKYEF